MNNPSVYRQTFKFWGNRLHLIIVQRDGTGDIETIVAEEHLSPEEAKEWGAMPQRAMLDGVKAFLIALASVNVSLDDGRVERAVAVVIESIENISTANRPC